MALPALLIPQLARASAARILQGRVAAGTASNAQRVALRAVRLSRARRRDATFLRPVENPLDDFLVLGRILFNGYFSAAAPAGWTNLGPWSLYASCPSPDLTYSGPYGFIAAAAGANSSTVANNASNCANLLAASFVGDPWAGVTTSRRSVLIGRTKVIGGSPRAQGQEAYTRSTTGAFDKPIYQAASAARAIPPHVAGVIPPVYPERPAIWQLMPDVMPIGQWLPRPAQLTAAQARSVRNAFPSGSIQLDPPSPKFQPILAGSSRPIKNRFSYPAGAFNASQKFGHRLRPPTKNEKEKKVKAGRALKAIMDVAGHADEALQVVDALYYALPERVRPRYKDTRYVKKKLKPQEKMRAIYDNWREIDDQTFRNNMLRQFATDAIIGRMAKSMRASQIKGTGYTRPLSWTVGPAL